MTRKVALTGIKPTGGGAPHIGNLLGAIEPAIALTESYDGIYFIADYHALTTEHDGARMQDAIHQVAATWMAMGLDVDNHIFFKQSDVPEVCELQWMLSCFTVGSTVRQMTLEIGPWRTGASIPRENVSMFFKKEFSS